jgi:hypothetical protein
MRHEIRKSTDDERAGIADDWKKRADPGMIANIEYLLSDPMCFGVVRMGSLMPFLTPGASLIILKL